LEIGLLLDNICNADTAVLGDKNIQIG